MAFKNNLEEFMLEELLKNLGKKAVLKIEDDYQVFKLECFIKSITSYNTLTKDYGENHLGVEIIEIDSELSNYVNLSDIVGVDEK